MSYNFYNLAIMGHMLSEGHNARYDVFKYLESILIFT